MKHWLNITLGCLMLPTMVTPFVLSSCDTRTKYTVNFYLNDGTEELYKSVKVVKGDSVEKPTNPTRTGYTFAGWYTDKDAENAYNFSAEINGDRNLYAYWIVIEPGDEEIYLNNLNIKKDICSNGYLAEATYSQYSNLDGSLFNQLATNLPQGSCSSFYKNGFYGRNFEWVYNKIPEMIIHTTADASINRYATVGVSYCSEFANPSELGTTGKLTQHARIPWYTVDGINEKGLVASINEVPLDNETILENKGDGSTDKPNLTELQLVRYLLDYCSSVADAEEKIKQYNIIGINGLNEQHIMVADKSGDCAEIEFVPISSSDLNHKTPKFFRKAKEDSHFENIITNFTMIDYKGDCDANWYKDTTSLGPEAEGCERYNILYKKLITDDASVTSLDDVLSIMAEVYYTKSYSLELTDYSDTFWFSEFNYGSKTKTTPHTKANYQSSVGGWNFNKATWDAKGYTRSQRFYCTRNSCAYDLNNLKLKLIFEENYPIEKVFNITRE